MDSFPFPFWQPQRSNKEQTNEKDHRKAPKSKECQQLFSSEYPLKLLFLSSREHFGTATVCHPNGKRKRPHSFMIPACAQCTSKCPQLEGNARGDG